MRHCHMEHDDWWLAEHDHGHEAYELFLRMQAEGYTPDTLT